MTDNQDVKFFVLPDGYRVEANGTVKVYPLIRGLDLKFETEVASELGLDPKRVISAIDRAGGLKPELADEWAYGAEEYAETAKARGSIRSTLRLSPREMDPRRKYEHVSSVAYQHLLSNGNFHYAPARRECFWSDAESKVLFTMQSEDFKAHLSTRLQLSREDIAFKHVFSWMLDRTIKYGQRVEPRLLSYYDPVERVLYFNNAPGRVLALNGASITEEDNGKHVLFTWDSDWEPVQPVYENRGLLNELVFGRLLLDEDESNVTLEESRLLDERWVLGLLFRSLLPERPINALIGEAGSGKTIYFELIGRMLFGKRFSVLGFEDAKEDGAIAYVTSSCYGVFDNADEPNRWLPDMLARASTGMSIPRRQLYTTNALAKYLVDIFLGITARQTPWARLDVIDRLLLRRVKRPAQFISRKVFFTQIADNRAILTGELLLKANEAVRRLREQDSDDEADSPYRLSSFYSFSVKTVDAKERDTLKKAFAKIVGLQEQLHTEQEENLLTLLKDWLANISSDDLGKDPPQWTRPLRVSEVYARLAVRAKTGGFKFTVRSPLSLGHKLGSLRPTLRTSRIRFEKGKDNDGVWWRFRLPQKEEANHPSEPSQPSLLSPDPAQNTGRQTVKNLGGSVQSFVNPSPGNEEKSGSVKDVNVFSAKEAPSQPSRLSSASTVEKTAIQLGSASSDGSDSSQTSPARGFQTPLAPSAGFPVERISELLEFILRDAIPSLERRQGYGTAPQLLYHTQDKFGTTVSKETVDSLLAQIEKDGLVFQVRRGCWKLVK